MVAKRLRSLLALFSGAALPPQAIAPTGRGSWSDLPGAHAPTACVSTAASHRGSRPKSLGGEGRKSSGKLVQFSFEPGESQALSTSTSLMPSLERLGSASTGRDLL